MRSEELLALLLRIFFLQNESISTKIIQKINGEELFLEPKTPKAKHCIAIPDSLYNNIKKYIAKLYGIKENDQTFYFTKSALDKEIKSSAKKAGLPFIKVHNLRHSHVSMLIEMGFTPLQIAERLGHESIKTTLDTYSHLYPDKDQQLANALDKIRLNETRQKKTLELFNILCYSLNERKVSAGNRYPSRNLTPKVEFPKPERLSLNERRPSWC